MSLLSFSGSPPESSARHIVNQDGKQTANRAGSIAIPVRSQYPHLLLPVKSLSTSTAAHLAISVLHHVLFLKGQVPLPIPALSRMRQAYDEKASSEGRDRTGKAKGKEKAAALLDSVDLLESHLETALVAASTALAQLTLSDDRTHLSIATVYLSVLLGPSIGTAKARVMCALTGLEVKKWGERYDCSTDLQDDESDDADSSGKGSEDDCDCVSEDALSLSPSPSPSPSSSAGPSPSSSRSPSPSAFITSESCLPLNSVSTNDSRHASVDIDSVHATRLLAKVLATYHAEEDDEGWMSTSDMAPTHIHFLLRAPRRFVHPAWTPQPAAGRSLDKLLQDFLHASGWSKPEPADRENGDQPEREKAKDIEKGSKQAGKKKSRPEGVWIGCTDARLDDPWAIEEKIVSGEDDDMIWWAWDGKMSGFSEW